jgi:hypothetical protein
MPDDEITQTKVERALRPNPDPSVRTTEQIDRVVGASMDVINEKIGRLYERLEGYDKAIDVLAEAQARLPNVGMVDSDVKHLAQLADEKFTSIKTLIEKTGELNNTALQAAFAAAKEAVGAAQIANATANTKMETNFTKQLDATVLLISTMEKSFNSKSDDIKAQVMGTIPRIEVTAALNAMNDRQASSEKIIANYQGALLMVGLLAAAIPTIVTVLLHFLK